MPKPLSEILMATTLAPNNAHKIAAKKDADTGSGRCLESVFTKML
jgi:hypothetical protein